MNVLKPLMIQMTLAALTGCGDKDDTGETAEDTTAEDTTTEE